MLSSKSRLAIAKLLEFSFEDIDYDFDYLTHAEREIIGDEKTFDEIAKFVCETFFNEGK